MKAVVRSFRLRTIPLSLSPGMVGIFIARDTGCFKWSVCLFLLLTIVSLQILSNLANELGDWKKGTDREQSGRQALSLQKGNLTVYAFQYIIGFFVFLCAVFGVCLIYFSFGTLFTREPLLFLALGALTIAAAVYYSLGRRPYGYYGLGDLSVFLFFGIVGVVGSYYLLCKEIVLEIFLPAVSMGLLITGVLNVNNIRDIDNDACFGKNTFALLLCRKFGKDSSTVPAKWYQAGLLAGALAASVVYAFIADHGNFLFLLSIPLLVFHTVKLWKGKGAQLDSAFKILVAGVLLYALLLF